jgi:anaerobic magnesium-protoporphyrin IX monomethyl ester cyclase
MTNPIRFSLLSLMAFEPHKFTERGARDEFQTVKMAVVALLKHLEKNGYTRDDYDFYDIDMLIPSDDEIRAYFKKYQPTVIGLSAILASTYPEVKRVARLAREVCPDAWIIMGGHLAAASNTVLRKTEVDLCIAGDGEHPLIEFLDYVKRNGRAWNYEELANVRGLCFFDASDTLRFTGWPLGIPAEDLENPDYEMLARGLKNQPELIRNYFTDDFSFGSYDPRYQTAPGPHKIAIVPTSKGCVARCTFCQRASKGYRAMSLAKLEQHIIELKRDWGVTAISVADENFGSDVKQARAFAALMKKHGLFWKAGGVRVSTFDGDDIRFLRDNNCLDLRFGLEAGSDDALDLMEKRISVREILDSFRYCVEADLSSRMSSWLIGMPGDDDEIALETGRTIAKIAHLQGVPITTGLGEFLTTGNVNYVMPVPGTPLYEYGQRVGVLPTDPDGEENYFHHLATVQNPSKANYTNVNGAPLKEWYFWDILILLEASRTYRQLCRETPPDPTRFSARTILDYVRYKSYRPSLRELYGNFYWAIGQWWIDGLPRWLVYPALRNLNYFCNVTVKTIVRRIMRRPDATRFPGTAVQRLQIQRYGTRVSRATPLRRFLKTNLATAKENCELETLTRGQ